MLTIGYSTKTPKPEFIEYLKKSSGFKKIEVIEKVNNGEKSLSQTYNEILSESKTDIVVFCHDDIYFDTNSWYHKILKHFEKTDYGIIGVAGTTIMAETGTWWETKYRKSMQGIVNHESEGKKWETRFSGEFGNSIRRVCVLDGVFFAVHKKRIKSNFDEDFQGFHFYDIPFTLQNHLLDVKVGVITNVRITHKSIGVPNEQWYTNQKLFVEKFQSNLPCFTPIEYQQQLNVLISCLSFKTFTGSEVYVYELARSLQKQNCYVTIISQIGGPITDLAKRNGIRVLPFEKAPGFKQGDGVWLVQDGPTGKPVPSTPGVLYKIAEPDFDIIHVQHTPVTKRILDMYPLIPKISTIHSEVIELENPYPHESIKRYIAIRPEIKNYICEKFDIKENTVEVIYNPVDNDKFKTTKAVEGNYVLFVGTIDYLREQTIKDLVEYSKSIGKELWLVGDNKSNYLDSLLINNHVKHFKSSWTIEKYIHNCYETAGIQLGRTTIESWMCGKKSWIYTVDSNGNIQSKQLLDPPTDIEKYHSTNVAKKTKEEYIKVLSGIW